MVGRGRRGRRRGQRRADHDRHVPVLVPLVQDEGLGRRGPPRGLEGELVAARNQAERSSVEVVGDDLGVHRDLHGGQLAPGGVLHLEDDRGDGGGEQVHPARALVAHLGRAAPRRADEELSSRLPELVLRPELDGRVAGLQALGHGRVGRSGRAVDGERQQSERQAKRRGDAPSWRSRQSYPRIGPTTRTDRRIVTGHGGTWLVARSPGCDARSGPRPGDASRCTRNPACSFS